MKSKDGTKLVAKNRKARFDYEFLETYEAGLVLTGTEIKSIRLSGQVSLRQGYVQPHNGELYLTSVDIAEFKHGNRENHEPTRRRKLLLHRKEIDEILNQLATNGVTCIPVRMYLKKGRAKVEIAVARGKKTYDKRKDIAKRDANRQMQRAVKEAGY